MLLRISYLKQFYKLLFHSNFMYMKTFKSVFPFKFFVILLAGLFISGCEKDPFDANSGTFTDKRDGHEYKWVKIGEQIWMAENLAYLPVQPYAPDSQCGVWVYGYEGEDSYGTNYFTYGCLYDWETAQKVCPDGWHLPSDKEWMELERFLGMKEIELDRYSCRGLNENIAAKLILNEQNLWAEQYSYNNETGFSSLPGGERNIWYTESEFHYKGINYFASFWTSTVENDKDAINRTVSSCIDRMPKLKKAGFAVRCIKN